MARQAILGRKSPASSEGINEFAQPQGATLMSAVKSILGNPNFRKWFGKSKVVDEKGEPLVVYHGTGAESIEIFDMKKKASDYGDTELGFFFSADKETASEFGENKIPVYLSITNPKRFSASEYFEMANDSPDWWVKDFKRLRKSLVKEGYDGIYIPKDTSISKNNPGWGQFNADTWIAFKSNKIKSLFNEGTFDPANPNILKSSRKLADVWYSQMEKFLSQKLPGSGTPANLKMTLQAWAKKGDIKEEELNVVGCAGLA